jgi:hypothetical protein
MSLYNRVDRNPVGFIHVATISDCALSDQCDAPDHERSMGMDLIERNSDLP